MIYSFFCGTQRDLNGVQSNIGSQWFFKISFLCSIEESGWVNELEFLGELSIQCYSNYISEHQWTVNTFIHLLGRTVKSVKCLGSLPQFPIFFCRSKNFCRLSVGISSKLIPWLLALCGNRKEDISISTQHV